MEMRSIKMMKVQETLKLEEDNSNLIGQKHLITLVLIFALSFLLNLYSAEASQKGCLFIDTMPENAKIRILNIKQQFKQGIFLKNNKYLLEVSHEGYETEDIWVKIDSKETKRIKIFLEKRNTSIADSYPLSKYHKVRKYDTLWRISKKYHVSVRDLKLLNNLKNNRLDIGQKILIRPKPIHKRLTSDENKKDEKQLLMTGHKYLYEGEYDRAIEFYELSIKNNPYYLKSYYSIGFAYLKIGNYQKALKFFKKAVEINPTDINSHYILGLVYFIIEEKDSAIGQYKIIKKADKLCADNLLGYIKIL